MKFARYVSFIVLSLVCFSQTVFASDFSDKVISNTNTEITHAQTIFDTEKESHTFIVANSNSELSQISQRKKVDLGNSNFFTASNILYINEPQNKILGSNFGKEITIKRLFLSEYSPHAP